MVSSRLFDIIVAAMKEPKDEILRGVLCDALEEEGYSSQKNVLNGVCPNPNCSGELQPTRTFLTCKKCGNEDIYYQSTNVIGLYETRLDRVIKELGLKKCNNWRHFASFDGAYLSGYWEIVGDCGGCFGCGILRPRK